MSTKPQHIGTNPFVKTHDTVYIGQSEETGFATLGRSIVADIPSGVPGHATGCLWEATDTGDVYHNMGDEISCNFVVFSGTATTPAGITLNDGDIIVGNVSNVGAGVTPSGDVSMDDAGVFTVVGIDGIALSGAATVDASFYVSDTSNLNPVVMSGDATMDDTGVITVTAINGVTIDSTATDANMLIADGSQFNSVAMSGDATIDDTGAITVASSSSNFLVNGVYQNSVGTRNGPGALNVTFGQNEITTTGTGDAITLVDGLDGQTMDILYVAEAAGGDTAVLTPSNLAGGTTITFNAVGDTARLVFSDNSGNWFFMGGTAIKA